MGTPLFVFSVRRTVCAPARRSRTPCGPERRAGGAARPESGEAHPARGYPSEEYPSLPAFEILPCCGARRPGRSCRRRSAASGTSERDALTGSGTDHTGRRTSAATDDAASHLGKRAQPIAPDGVPADLAHPVRASDDALQRGVDLVDLTCVCAHRLELRERSPARRQQPRGTDRNVHGLPLDDRAHSRTVPHRQVRRRSALRGLWRDAGAKAAADVARTQSMR